MTIRSADSTDLEASQSTTLHAVGSFTLFIRLAPATLAAMLFAVASFAPADEPAAGASAPPPPRSWALRIDGRWILDAGGNAVGPDDFRRGLQTSGLAYSNGSLWSVGDQRSRYPGSILEIDPATARVRGEPLRLAVTEKTVGETEDLGRFTEIPNIDLEGLAVVEFFGRRSEGFPRFIAVTEDKSPWILVLNPPPESDPPGTVPDGRLTALHPLRIPDGIRPWRDDTNFRLEGIAMSDRNEIYFAFERASDDLPRIFQYVDAETQLRNVPIDFSAIPKRADKPRALLNLNGLEYLRWRGRGLLLAVARDQERVVVIDLDEKRVASWADLDLRDEDGQSVEWVSPEGIAADVESDRLWIVNDPDSVRGNYRRRDTEKAEGRYAEYAPLLFTTRLSAIIDGAIVPSDFDPATVEK